MWLRDTSAVSSGVSWVHYAEECPRYRLEGYVKLSLIDPYKFLFYLTATTYRCITLCHICNAQRTSRHIMEFVCHRKCSISARLTYKANVLSSNSIFLVSSRAGNDIYGVFRGEIQSSFSVVSPQRETVYSQIGCATKNRCWIESERNAFECAGEAIQRF